MSNETKFTKGEWKIVKSVAFDCEHGNVGETTMLSIGSRIFPICHHGIQGKCFDYDEQVANAHLIKKAPKLYALLDKIQQGSQDYIENGKMYDDIEKLLAEARGEK